RRNRAMVIAAVRRGGQPSRTEIASATGLSHSTISTISSDLIEEGVLAPAKGAEAAVSRRGRPQVALGLNPRAAGVVTIVLSLNALSAALVDYAGNAVAHDMSRPATLTLSQRELLEATQAAVRRVLAQAGPGHGPLLRITLAIQGIT